MRRALLLVVALVATVLAAGGQPAGAAASGITFTTGPGTGAPPGTLGGYTMRPFSPDPDAGGPVDHAPGPTGNISFDRSMLHTQVGQGWDTWSHGYTGDVYVTDGPRIRTLTLPANTRAASFYAEPDQLAQMTIRATAQDGTSSGDLTVNGLGGAEYFGFFSTGRTVLKRITVSSSDDFAVGEFAVSTGTSKLAYAALGDSFSSGEGVGSYELGTDTAKDACHRSARAWPRLLPNLANLDLAAFYACSGATTAALLSKRLQTEPAQLKRLDSSDLAANLVTVTIGGNDLGLGDLLRTCASGSGCAGRVTAANAYLDGKLPGVLDKTFAAMHKALPNARIVVVGYPNLINPKVSEARRRCSWLTQDSFVTGLVALAGKLELTIFAAARAHGLLYDSTLDAMQGHELCTDNPYLNAVSAAGGQPNAQGQVALARDVAVYLTL